MNLIQDKFSLFSLHRNMVAFENFIIRSNQGFDLIADLYLCRGIDKKPIVIFCHGFKGFKDWGHFPLLADHFIEKEFNFLKFNFSHNGGTLQNPIDFPDLESFAKNNYSLELNDVQTVLNWITSSENPHSNRINTEEIYLIGHSRGGGISIITASVDKRIKKLVTWSALSDFSRRFPAASLMEKWKKNGVYFIENTRTRQKMPLYYQFYEDFIQNKAKLNIAEAEKKLNIPHLIIHGTEDETVYLGEALYLISLNEYSSLIKIKNATHTFGGYHPYKEKKIPAHAEMAVNYTISFFQNE